MQEDWKPKVDMVFDSMNDAWKFWIDYGGRVGFGVRKQYIHKSKDGSTTSCRFVCCKEGLRKPDKRDYKTIKPRAETRTNCQARIGLKNMGEVWIVRDFVEEHNHIFHLKETTHMLSSQRKVSEIQCQQIELADDAGLQQKNSFDLMSKEVGGRTNLGFTRLDQKNHLRNRRQRSLVHGEAGYLLQYFQKMSVENPSFYHAYQMDMEDQITNVFWADARMLIDYGYFGDVISLDATYCTNSSHRPLAVFLGFNHHRKAVIFGAALLYDETAESYKWLFETFLEAHKQKKPQTVFTDQDHAMAKALVEVIPETYHGLCTWHLMQNGIKHLGNLMKGGSHFLSDLKKCMYEYDDEEQFEESWRNLLINYKFEENTWLRRVYNVKEKWASCYMKKAFTLGMRSTQLSESVNANIKSIMNVNLDIIKFFKCFEDVIEEKRYNESKCEYEARQKIPRLRNSYSDILQQMSEIYTPTIFELFQNEYELFEACSIKSFNIQTSTIDYVISMARDLGEWQVFFNFDKNSINCSCRKFESFGILCCHCLKVFIHIGVKSVPRAYILKRWTKSARSGVSHIVEDADFSHDQCYKVICPRLIRIATEACRSPETFTFLAKVVDELDKCILKFQNSHVSGAQVNIFLSKVKEIESSIDNSTHVSGFKKKQGGKGSKRKKGWVETKLTDRKKSDGASTSQIKINTGTVQIMKSKKSEKLSNSQRQVQYEVVDMSAPIWLNDAYNNMKNNETLSSFGDISFTSLLMENNHEDTSGKEGVVEEKE
ncbi:protein FAR1-RELATED SEQUENCE 5-like [Vicia villosa]|uniref:protein FAR1-RELATED SEQUENCE 5-like n=1 Tax=Vicia villosa TaxID=3911 RepID=UPI00273B280A|nr:protein FAR1-RELATED SEQUENCE 5-like [Vicia villosa]